LRADSRRSRARKRNLGRGEGRATGGETRAAVGDQADRSRDARGARGRQGRVGLVALDSRVKPRYRL